jgi:hypothetical protein
VAFAEERARAPRPSFAHLMHPRNRCASDCARAGSAAWLRCGFRYRQSPDFAELAQRHPSLREHLIRTANPHRPALAWSNPAVRNMPVCVPVAFGMLYCARRARVVPLSRGRTPTDAACQHTRTHTHAARINGECRSRRRRHPYVPHGSPSNSKWLASQALQALSCALLKDDFGLDVHLPQNHLIPAIPLRLNYLHWIEGAHSPGADVAGASPSPGADVAVVSPSPGADVRRAEPSPDGSATRSLATALYGQRACRSAGSALGRSSPALQMRSVNALPFSLAR